MSGYVKEESLITPDRVRLALMDYTDVNIPLMLEYVNEDRLWQCIFWAMDYINESPPILFRQYTLQDFPAPKLILDGAVVEALKLTALMDLRGEMQYSDGGIQSSIYYKSPQFTALRQELDQSFKHEVLRYKRDLNMKACYGGVS